MTSIHHVRRGAHPAVAVALTVLGLAAAAAVLVLVTPARAAAHARIAGTTPADGSHVAALPDRVAITFSAKPATVEGDPLRVYDPSGRRIDDGDVRVERGGEVLSVGLVAAGGATGRYAVAYHVVSADSHLLVGRFGFTVAGAGGDVGPAGDIGSVGSAGAAAAAPASGEAAGSSVGGGPAGDTAIGTAVSLERGSPAAQPGPSPTPAPDRQLRRAGPTDLRPELLVAGTVAVGAAARAGRSRAARRSGARSPGDGGAGRGGSPRSRVA